MNTDTPETSVAWNESCPLKKLSDAERKDFAAKLERERDDAREQRDRLEESILNLSHPNCKMLIRERDEAREQRDRLAEVLQSIRDGYGGQVATLDCCEDCEFLIRIDKALQSMTPNSQDQEQP